MWCAGNLIIMMLRIQEMPTWADSKAVLPSAPICISTGVALFCWMNLFMKYCTGTHQAAGGCLAVPAATVCRPLTWKTSRSPSDRWSRRPVSTSIIISLTCRGWVNWEGDYQEWPVGSWVQFRCIFMISSARNYIHVIIWDKIFKERQTETKSAIFLSESQTGQLVVRFRYLVGVRLTF